MLLVDSSFTHAVATTPTGSAGCFAHLAQRQRPSPNLRRVGSRIALFEACSAFTRVTACTLAKSPKATLYTEGFGCFVTSTTAPIATGKSDSCPAGTRTPLKTGAFPRHTEKLRVSGPNPEQVNRY